MLLTGLFAVSLLSGGAIRAQESPANVYDGPGLPSANFSNSAPLPGAVILPGFESSQQLAASSGADASSSLSPPADYDWWNGCSPTAAAMLFGYWEEHGYDAFPGNHRNLPATFPNTSTNPVHYTDARGVIAGWAHKQAGMAKGYDYGSPEGHVADSLADFMLTSDGGTSRLYNVMAHGMKTFAAWDDPRTPEIESRKFQVESVFRPGAMPGGSGDWTYEDYCAEIDAGRPVHLGLKSGDSGHSVLGVGYYDDGDVQDVILLTTWHSGLQQWEWTNESHSGHHYTVYGARLATPDPTPCPELSAYFFIAEALGQGVDVEIGVGDPGDPLWSVIANTAAPEINYDTIDINLALTDIDCTGAMDLFNGGFQQWYLKVDSHFPEDGGTIEDFQIRLGFDEHVFKCDGPPVVLSAEQSTIVYLTTVPVPEPAAAAMLLILAAGILVRRVRG
jgi:hypothetical protein